MPLAEQRVHLHGSTDEVGKLGGRAAWLDNHLQLCEGILAPLSCPDNDLKQGHALTSQHEGRCTAGHGACWVGEDASYSEQA